MGYFQKILEALKNFKLENTQLKNLGLQNSAYFILFCVLAREPINICKHFDPSVDAESRYYKFGESSGLWLQRVYDWNTTNPNDSIIQPIVNSSCIGDSPGKNLDQCKFNGYLKKHELCNPCEVEKFKEVCEDLCETTTGPPFGKFKLG